MIHQKKNRGHRTSKIVKSRQSYNNDHLSYRCSFYYLARALVHDVESEFACAVRMRRNNQRESPYTQCGRGLGSQCFRYGLNSERTNARRVFRFAHKSNCESRTRRDKNLPRHA